LVANNNSTVAGAKFDRSTIESLDHVAVASS
jgi:hypothetical protein